MQEIKAGHAGVIGILHNIEYSPNNMLVFQVARKTSMINTEYMNSALKAVKEKIPEGTAVLIIGADVNIYEIASEEAVMLKLKGIVP